MAANKNAIAAVPSSLTWLAWMPTWCDLTSTRELPEGSRMKCWRVPKVKGWALQYSAQSSAKNSSDHSTPLPM